MRGGVRVHVLVTPRAASGYLTGLYLNQTCEQLRRTVLSKKRGINDLTPHVTYAIVKKMKPQEKFMLSVLIVSKEDSAN